MWLASLCSGGWKTFCLFTLQSQQGGIVLPLWHLKFSLIPKCVNPLFSDHNGNVKCKVDLDGLDRQSREKSLKMLCICVSLAAWGGMCWSGTAEQRMIWIWVICCCCCYSSLFFQELSCLGLELWQHKLSYFYPKYSLCIHGTQP